MGFVTLHLHRLLPIAIGIVALVLGGCGSSGDESAAGGTGGAGGSGGSAGSGGSDACTPAAFDIAGTFNERYNCRFVPSQTCSGEDVFTVVIIDESTNGVDYTFNNTVDMTTGSGKLCGNEFEWTSMGGGFTEMGVWTFTDADNVTIETTFTGPGEDGECVAVATRDPEQPGAPPALPCTP
jgi:hypothetical protein